MKGNQIMKTIAQQLNVTKFPFIIKDENGNDIYYENFSGVWYKSEYDEVGNEIHYEDSKGIILNKQIIADKFNIDVNKRIVELTLDQIADKFNIDVNQLKVVK